LPQARRNVLWPLVPAAIAALSFAFVLYAIAMPEHPAAAAPTPAIASAAPQAAPAASEPTAAPQQQVAAASTAPAPKSAAPANVASWKVDKAASSIGFAGEASGGAFTGGFRDWDAAILFSPDNLAASKANVTIRMASVTLSDSTGQDTAKTPDWLSIA